MAQTHDIPMSIKMNDPCFPDIAKLDQGLPIDEAQIHTILDYIDLRLDCADFRVICILRSLYYYSDQLTEPTLSRMKQTILGFKYWMDEPGTDSMCYWSENHQLIFATCEYLAGQLYPNELFTNDGMLGRYHQAKAAHRLSLWLDARFRFGFVEWHSNTYYEEDIAPLSLLIDCASDSTLVAKATSILDLLLLDMALHHYRGYLAATSGRCYEKQKKYPAQQDVTSILVKAFGLVPGERVGTAGAAEAAGAVDDKQASTPEFIYDYTRVSADFILNRKYRVPDWIRRISQDENLGVVRSSMGLNLAEIDHYFPVKDDVYGRGMYLWSMEAFSNPESCEMALRLYREWKLETNDFLKNLGALDIPVISRIGLLPTAVRVLNPVTSGIAIQRVNSYSYRTADYFLSSAQQYHPGTFGDQQHIWQATIGSGISVFTTHPGAAFFEDNARNFSPSYWVGNGVLPDCRQEKNVVLCVYDLSVRKGYMEKERLLFTHAWFPQKSFDEMHRAHVRCYVAREGSSYVGLLSLKTLEEKGDDELIQQGTVTAWACVVGSAAEYGTFSKFVAACSAARLEQKGRLFTLTLRDQLYELTYDGAFVVNGAQADGVAGGGLDGGGFGQDKNYPRLSCRYGEIPGDPEVYDLTVDGENVRIAWPTKIRDLRRPDLPEVDPCERIVALCDDVVARTDPKMKWMWGQALLGYALTELDRYRGTDQYTPFLTTYCQYWLEHKPKIDYADRIAPALITYAMEKRTGNVAFAELTREALDYIRYAPRLLGDAVNHLGTSFESHFYPKSIWVDSLMMFSFFPSLYGKEQGDRELLDFAARQPAMYAQYLQDESHLWVHSYWVNAGRQHPRGKRAGSGAGVGAGVGAGAGVDAGAGAGAGDRARAASDAGSASFWGRGNGWVMTSLPMIMENVGTDHPAYEEIRKIFCDTAEDLLPWQNDDGSFNTIINKPSYREMSATALIACGFLHGVRLGVLDKTKYLSPGLRALTVVSDVIAVDDQNVRSPRIYLPEISAPTIPLPLFPTAGYKLTPRGRNQSYGLAAALFAALEYRKLCDLGMIGQDTD